MIKLKKQDIELLKEIAMTPYTVLFKEVRDKDYLEKKTLIEMIYTFKKTYNKNPSSKAKDIIIYLMKDLEKLNGRIERIEKEIANA